MEHSFYAAAMFSSGLQLSRIFPVLLPKGILGAFLWILGVLGVWGQWEIVLPKQMQVSGYGPVTQCPFFIH